METVIVTDRGKVRQHNEDSVGVFKNEDGDVLAVVADGMGGHLAGDVASQMTIATLKEMWESASRISSPDLAVNWLKEHIEKVNSILLEHALTHPDCKGMGTTVVAAICTGSFATIGHIGDSRGYLCNTDGFKQITEDHSLVNELVRSGQISKEDAEHHPRKNVLVRALGTEEHVELDLTSICLEESDILLLCSDGLSNKVGESEMKQTLTSLGSLNEIALSLVNQANDNGGEDNISLVIVKQPSEIKEGDQTC
jgi:protein phosphatase